MSDQKNAVKQTRFLVFGNDGDVKSIKFKIMYENYVFTFLGK
jgi:hypothetical protein